MPTYTANLALAKPNTNETNWGTALNANFDTIDSKIAAVSQFPLGQAAEVAFSATPNFDLSVKSSQHIILTGNVTSSTVSGARDGQLYAFIIEQNSAGGHSFAFPSNFKNAAVINSANLNVAGNSVATQVFIYIASRAAFFAITPLMYA